MAFVAPFPGGASVTFVYESGLNSAAAAAPPVTFASVPFGTAAANRYIVITVASVNVGGGTVTGVTVGGVAATNVANVTNSGGAFPVRSGIWIASVPTGASGNIVVSDSDAFVDISIGVYAIYAPSSAAPSATGTSTAATPSVTLTAPANGVIIGGLAGTSGAGTWTGLTKNVVLTWGEAASAASTSGGSLTVSVSGPGAQPALAVATWGP